MYMYVVIIYALINNAAAMDNNETTIDVCVVVVDAAELK